MGCRLLMLQGDVVALYQHPVKTLTNLESSGIIFLGRAEVSCNAVLHVDCPRLINPQVAYIICSRQEKTQRSFNHSKQRVGIIPPDLSPHASCHPKAEQHTRTHPLHCSEKHKLYPSVAQQRTVPNISSQPHQTPTTNPNKPQTSHCKPNRITLTSPTKTTLRINTLKALRSPKKHHIPSRTISTAHRYPCRADTVSLSRRRN